MGEGCKCFSASAATADGVDLDGAERDVARTLVALLDCSSLPSACIGVYHVHCAPRVTPHTPQVHTVVMGREPGVHMCTCLQLAHKGLPCRHFFAVLMQYPDLHFDVRAACAPLTHKRVTAVELYAAQYVTACMCNECE